MQHWHYSRFLVLVFTYVLIQTKRKSNPEATLIIRPDRKWLERNFEEEIFISFQYVRISILQWRWISIGVCLLNYPWWITRFVYFTFFLCFTSSAHSVPQHCPGQDRSSHNTVYLYFILLLHTYYVYITIFRG